MTIRVIEQSLGKNCWTQIYRRGGLFCLNIVCLLFVLAISVNDAAAFQENQEIIFANEWPALETSSDVLALPQIQNILKAFDEAKQMAIEIRYPGGEAGRAWGESIAQWLTTFGVPQQHLAIRSGSGAADRVVLEIFHAQRSSKLF